MSDTNNTVAADELRAFIERVEHVEAEQADLSAGKSEIYAEAQGRGYDTKVMREIVKIRKQDPTKRSEHGAVMELYCDALGMML